MEMAPNSDQLEAVGFFYIHALLNPDEIAESVRRPVTWIRTLIEDGGFQRTEEDEKLKARLIELGFRSLQEWATDRWELPMAEMARELRLTYGAFVERYEEFLRRLRDAGEKDYKGILRDAG